MSSLLGGQTPNAPLADRIRPTSLEQFVGQEHLRERLAALLGAERLPSLLFFGPPGTGKSTLALLLARASGRPFKRVSAPETGLPELRKGLSGIEILVLDELHRYSKAQQDYFLPILESGAITLLASTTENPSFSVTRQLLSRLHVLKLAPLADGDLLTLAARGLDELGAELPDGAAEVLVGASGGDARTLLNLVEYAATLPGEAREPGHLRAALPDALTRGDRTGDFHYELASALIKSIRGSDPDAALYYLASLIEGGEDPRFIARRLIISAAEDVGLADPRALSLAVACQQAVEFVGLPEGVIPLAEATVYLALAPKSNTAYAAIATARKAVKEHGVKPVPMHLRNATTKLQREWGFGKGYKYPHSFSGAWVDQQYLPDDLAGMRFYQPKEEGWERELAFKYLERLRNR